MSKFNHISSVYDVIRAPIITEKATAEGEVNKYRFRVHKQANKADVKKAVSIIYNVGVEDVNIMLRRSKTKTFRGIKSSKNRPSCSENLKTSATKIAIVTLKQGDEIALFQN